MTLSPVTKAVTVPHASKVTCRTTFSFQCQSKPPAATTARQLQGTVLLCSIQRNKTAQAPLCMTLCTRAAHPLRPAAASAAGPVRWLPHPCGTSPLPFAPPRGPAQHAPARISQTHTCSTRWHTLGTACHVQHSTGCTQHATWHDSRRQAGGNPSAGKQACHRRLGTCAPSHHKHQQHP